MLFNKKNVLSYLLAVLILIPIHAVAHTAVDNSIWAGLLKKHVKGHTVSYKGFQQDESLLDKYLDILSQVKVDALSDHDRFAFYINVYNASTVKHILSKYPDIKSIKEIGGIFQSPWKIKFIPINGRTVSLDHIEHDILRPGFKDPRVHFAVNCASKSCPPLLDEPYEGDNLNDQLDNQTRLFINDRQQTYINGNTLYVSKIFKWFGKDFTLGVAGFVKSFADKEFKQKIEKAGNTLSLK